MGAVAQTDPAFHDAHANTFENQVDDLVEFLLPRGSGTERSLTFEIVAVNDLTGQSVKYGVTYFRPCSYTQVYVYKWGAPHYLVNAGNNGGVRGLELFPAEGHRHTLESIGPVIYKKGEFLWEDKPVKRGVVSGYGGKDPIILDGEELTCFADHDSCWRGCANNFENPRFDKREDDDLSKYDVTRFKVLSIRLEGHPGKNTEHGAYLRDAVWRNPDPENVYGVWALWTARFVLADAAYRQRVFSAEVDYNLWDVREPLTREGEQYEGGYNYRKGAAEVTPRDVNGRPKWNAVYFMEGDEKGRITRWGNQDLNPPVKICRETFFGGLAPMPESAHVIALERISTTFTSDYYIGQKVTYHPFKGRDDVQNAYPKPGPDEFKRDSYEDDYFPYEDDFYDDE